MPCIANTCDRVASARYHRVKALLRAGETKVHGFSRVRLQRAAFTAARHAAIALLTAAMLGRRAEAQFAKSTINVDLGSGAITGTLPFDVPFIVSATIGEPVREVQAWIAEVPKTTPDTAQNPIVCPAHSDSAWPCLIPLASWVLPSPIHAAFFYPGSR